jgi:hypothetical protein
VIVHLLDVFANYNWAWYHCSKPFQKLEGCNSLHQSALIFKDTLNVDDVDNDSTNGLSKVGVVSFVEEANSSINVWVNV